MSSKWRFLVSLSLFIAAANCDFFSAPQSQVLYEGGKTTLACHTQGNAFWQLNGTVYSELNAGFFESQGITSFDFFLGGSEVNKTLTIVGSVLNNNTIINCISVRQNVPVNISENATITVLRSPSNVTLHELNSTSVELTWFETFVPPTVTIQSYTVTVLNTSEPQSPQLLTSFTTEDPPPDNGLYSYVYNLGKEPTQCTQITFSITSTSSIGTSPPSNVTWESPVDAESSNFELKDSLSCSAAQVSKTLTVSFKPYRLCAFQTADYAISITRNGQRVASLPGTYTGYQQLLNVPITDLNLPLKQEDVYKATVAISSPYGNKQATVNCYFIDKLPDIGGLDNAGSDSGSDGFSASPGLIVGIIISSIVVLLVIALLIGVLIYFWRQSPVYSKLKQALSS